MTNVWLRLIFVTLMTTAVSATVAAQSQPQAPNAVAPDVQQLSADENFDLNISERHIVEQNFHASTAVGFATADARNVRIQVGVSLGAEKIDVLLRNVTGNVRFRASVQRLWDVIQSRPAVVPH